MPIYNLSTTRNDHCCITFNITVKAYFHYHKAVNLCWLDIVVVQCRLLEVEIMHHSSQHGLQT